MPGDDAAPSPVLTPVVASSVPHRGRAVKVVGVGGKRSLG
jgi:hypothetical protein